MKLTKRHLMLGAGALALSQQSLPAAAQTASRAFVSNHRGLFNGREVNYVATVSETLVNAGGDAPTASIVATSYVRRDADSATRPVLFLFNGGPIVSSALLHMFAFGPKRVAVAQDPAGPPLAPRLVDNSFSLLDAADLVFIDPAETGFSRIAPGASRSYFYSTVGDAQSTSDFITAWCRVNGRDHSPKYVMGESYGTLRATWVAGQLAETMPLDGVMLFGQAINMIETSQRANNAMAYATNLPALAAIGAYHGKAQRRGRSMKQLIDHAYSWGMNEYLMALTQGQNLSLAQKRRLARELEAMTGIGAAYYMDHGLIITKPDFAAELLKVEGRVLGIYDARYTAPAGAGDPASAVTASAHAMLAQHFTQNLGVERDMSEYRYSAPDAVANWNWSATSGIGGPFNDYNYQAHLSRAFAAAPQFRLMVGTGIYDLTTTVGPARYLVARSDFPRERVALRQYDGGHTAYINEAALGALSNDLRAFVNGGLPDD